jgi:hypothetical protein
MKIKRFEAYDYGYKWGGHAFVLARYKGGWQHFRFSVPFEDDEFVPCMVSGSPSTEYGKYDLEIVGETGSWNIDEFEIIEGSEKGFKEMIEMYTSAIKYNL